MVHNTVLQEYVVCGEGRGPGCRCGGEEGHWDTETDFGCHCGCGLLWRENYEGMEDATGSETELFGYWGEVQVMFRSELFRS